MAIKRNLIVNYLGQIWVAVMSMAFIPLYIKYLGIESYGLIGIFAILQGVLTILEVGLTYPLVQEMSRFSGGDNESQKLRNLLRSAELIALVLACLISVGVWLLSGILATDWLHAKKLPINVIAVSLSLMGVVVALRMAEGVYRATIIGLHRQELYNYVNSAMSTLRWAGAATIVIWVSPTIHAFLIWQGICSLFTLVAMATATYSVLPKSLYPGKFSLTVLSDIRGIAKGMILIAFLGMALTLLDKVMLSRLLDLGEYGYYNLAAIVAGGLFMLAVPIHQTYLPKFNELHAANNIVVLSDSYHKAAQLITVIVGSAALVLCGFSSEILYLWSHNNSVTGNSALILSILSIGNLLNCLMIMPYQLQYTFGWTSLMVKLISVLVICIIPALLLITPLFGAKGAACVWVGINIIYVILGIHFMHKKILRTEKWKWCIEDVAQPLVAAGFIVIIFRGLMPLFQSDFHQLIYIFLVSSLSVGLSALSVKNFRLYIFAKIF